MENCCRTRLQFFFSSKSTFLAERVKEQLGMINKNRKKQYYGNGDIECRIFGYWFLALVRGFAVLAIYLSI
jgi:hypothetical protein